MGEAGEMSGAAEREEIWAPEREVVEGRGSQAEKDEQQRQAQQQYPRRKAGLRPWPPAHANQPEGSQRAQRRHDRAERRAEQAARDDGNQNCEPPAHE